MTDNNNDYYQKLAHYNISFNNAIQQKLLQPTPTPLQFIKILNLSSIGTSQIDTTNHVISIRNVNCSTGIVQPASVLKTLSNNNDLPEPTEKRNPSDRKTVSKNNDLKKSTGCVKIKVTEKRKSKRIMHEPPYTKPKPSNFNSLQIANYCNSLNLNAKLANALNYSKAIENNCSRSIEGYSVSNLNSFKFIEKSEIGLDFELADSEFINKSLNNFDNLLLDSTLTQKTIEETLNSIESDNSRDSINDYISSLDVAQDYVKETMVNDSQVIDLVLDIEQDFIKSDEETAANSFTKEILNLDQINNNKSINYLADLNTELKVYNLKSIRKCKDHNFKNIVKADENRNSLSPIDKCNKDVVKIIQNENPNHKEIVKKLRIEIIENILISEQPDSSNLNNNSLKSKFKKSKDFDNNKENMEIESIEQEDYKKRQDTASNLAVNVSLKENDNPKLPQKKCQFTIDDIVSSSSKTSPVPPNSPSNDQNIYSPKNEFSDCKELFQEIFVNDEAIKDHVNRLFELYQLESKKMLDGLWSKAN